MTRVVGIVAALFLSMVMLSCQSNTRGLTVSGTTASKTPVSPRVGVPVTSPAGAVKVEPGTKSEPAPVAEPEPVRPRLVGAVVAVVNSDVVTRDEVLQTLAPDFAKVDMDTSLTGEGRQARKAELVNRELHRRVERLLALQEARRRLSQDDQDKITRNVDYYMQGLIRSAGSAAKFENELARAGKTMDSRRQDEVEKRQIAALWDQEIGEHNYVRPAEMTAYYQNHQGEYHQKRAVQVRQIFLPFDAYADEAHARQAGRDILGRLKKGEDFAHLAKEYSKDPNAAEGGLWKEFMEEGSGTLRPEVEKAAFSLGVKQTSDLIVTEIGCHIIKVEDVRPERQVPYTEVQDQIQDILRNEKTDAKRRQLIDKLFKNSYVEVKWQ